MKKITSFLLMLCIAVSMCFVFSGCSHEHEFSTNWSFDNATHWFACNDEDCLDVANKGAHAFIDIHGEERCAVCNMPKPATLPTAAVYQQACQNIYSELNNLIDGGSTVSFNGNNGFATLTALDPAYVQASQMELIQLKGVICFIDLLNKLLDNDNFQLSSSPLQFTVSYEKQNEESTVILKYLFDFNNNNIKMYWDVNGTMGEANTTTYVYMDIDYTFATSTLNGCTLQVKTFNDYMIGPMYLSYIYEKPTLYSANNYMPIYIASEIDDSKNAYILSMGANKENVIDLQADFTKEYTEMMNIMNP